MLNEVTPIKNFTLLIGDGNKNKDISNEDSKIQPAKKKYKDSNILINLIIVIFLVLTIGIIGGSFYFL